MASRTVSDCLFLWPQIVKKHSLPGLTTAPSVTTAATINTSDTTDAPAAAAAQTQQDQSWSYATALLFCVAVVTTIGEEDTRAIM